VIKDNKVVGEERLFSEAQTRFRYIVQGPDQALYVINDDPEGNIFKVMPF
jgi:glucose/arabinose dehydrogenase